MAKETAPPARVGDLMARIESWLKEKEYRIPVTWLEEPGHLVLGNPRGKTRARFTREEIEAEGGAERCAKDARQIAEDWKRLHATPAVLSRLPKGNREDLERYFGADAPAVRKVKK